MWKIWIYSFRVQIKLFLINNTGSNYIKANEHNYTLKTLFEPIEVSKKSATLSQIVLPKLSKSIIENVNCLEAYIKNIDENVLNPINKQRDNLERKYNNLYHFIFRFK